MISRATDRDPDRLWNDPAAAALWQDTPGDTAMGRALLSAEALRDELNQAALRLSLDSEGAAIDFMLPTLADPDEGAADHNWDVQVYCPEGLDRIARKAVEQVASEWDLDPRAADSEPADHGER